jgi:hypothetical protein
MKQIRPHLLFVLASIVLLTLAAPLTRQSTVAASASSILTSPVTTSSATVTVFATGLNNPRGLKFGPDGNL